MTEDNKEETKCDAEKDEESSTKQARKYEKPELKKYEQIDYVMPYSVE